MIIRSLAFVTLMFGAAGLTFAQEPAAHEKDFVFFNHAVAMHGPLAEGVPDEVVQKAKTVLNLSDVQVNAVKALLKMRNEATAQILKETEAAHRKVEELMRQTNPNPAEVGAAHLAVQSVHERLEQVQEKFRTDFKALLSADQRGQLARLNTASEQIEPLQMLGVLDGSNQGFHIAMPAIGAVRIHGQ
jgi:hypothetical protein